MCFCRKENEQVRVKVKKQSSKKLEEAAHLGMGSGAKSRDSGQGEIRGIVE